MKSQQEPSVREALRERAKRLARELVQLDCSEAALVRCFNAIDDLAALSKQEAATPAIGKLFDEFVASIEVIDGDACYDYARLYDIRAALKEALPVQEPAEPPKRVAKQNTPDIVAQTLGLEPYRSAPSVAPAEHVAWCRYIHKHEGPSRIVLCDSDAPGAFKVYQAASVVPADAPSPAQPEAREAPHSQGALDVLAERRRQIEKERWTPEHDDEHTDGVLALAASCYATADTGSPLPKVWPWDPADWKPKGKRRNLVRAGALILAEIERIDRAALSQGAAK
jgi:hypothetical protein